MNQILDYNPNKSSGGKSSGSDKIVRVFAVILIIFAVCLLGSGAYGLYKKKSEQTGSTNVQTPTQAKIEVEQKETTAVIKVSHDKAIEKLIYTWDGGKETINKGNGESTMEVEISLPAGEHTLTVKVTDVDGVETPFDQKIISETGEDSTKPEIKVPTNPSGLSLPVIVTDETALDYVTYRWNDEEEVKIEADEDDPKTIKFDVEIRKGENNLTIIAVDKNNNTTTKTDKYKGVTKPEVKITINSEKTSAAVNCYHEVEIKSVKAILNGQEFDIMKELELNEDEVHTEVNFDIGLAEGNNTLKVIVESSEGTQTEVTEEVEADVPVEEDNGIEIIIEKDEETTDKAVVTMKTQSPIKEANVIINDGYFEVNGVAGSTEASVDLPLEEATTTIKFTVITEDGNEKTEEKEITR